MSDTVDLGKLEKDIANARKILAERDRYDRERLQLEKVVARLHQEVANAEVALKGAQQRAVDAQAKFEHERNRYSLDLQTHRATVADAKAALDKDLSAHRARYAQDLALIATEHETAKRSMVADTNKVREEHVRLTRATADLKARIAALPS